MSNQPDPRFQGYQPPPDQAPTEESPAYGPANDTARTYRSDSSHAQSQHESYIDPAGNRVESRTEVYEDRNLERANIRFWIANVIYFLSGVLEVILLLRFLFRLLGANPSNGFVTFLYNLSYVFVAPFNGIFNNPAVGSIGVFEVSTLIAMLVYALIAWGLVSLGRLIFAPSYSGQSYTTTRRRGYQ